MSGGASDNVLSLTTDELKEKIAEEVGRAIEVSLPRFMERMQNTLLSTMEERISELREDLTNDRGKAKEKKGCSYNKFMACKPPIFNGEVDPIACQRWISDIEGVFERMHCDESDFVAYGTGQLRGQAKDWWDNLRNERGVEAIRAMTWEDFKAPFLKHHSPKAVVNKIKEEFMQLRQKGVTVDKITGMFMDKLKFCDDLVKTEEHKIYYYHTMLRAEYREFMTSSHYESLADIINAAREREIELKRQIERGERRALDENPSPTKKPKIGHGIANCPDKVTVCYKCYQPGHKKSECPELVGKKESADSRNETPKAKARSFQITAAEAKMEPDVVTEGVKHEAETLVRSGERLRLRDPLSPRKGYVVADALSRKDECAPIRVRSMQLIVTSGLLERIREAQTEAVKEENWKKERIKGMVKDLTERSNGMKYRNDRIWVPNTCGVKSLLLDEAHKSRYSIHPGATKMYRDLKQNYWWQGMKRDVAKYVEKCLICLQVKAEHQKPYGNTSEASGSQAGADARLK
ncbi:uncharacterized protein LOC110888718 [Helianthus annuus]|uniref:uncharacterized protein LOC110888718 n=1 Tax=Helianthus annuus TaxID=4232 RepID=UPI000B8FB2EC|nr:uncharacterized protein LOC110888718 [Helianthus annuus]